MTRATPKLWIWLMMGVSASAITAHSVSGQETVAVRFDDAEELVPDAADRRMLKDQIEAVVVRIAQRTYPYHQWHVDSDPAAQGAEFSFDIALGRKAGPGMEIEYWYLWYAVRRPGVRSSDTSADTIVNLSDVLAQGACRMLEQSKGELLSTGEAVTWQDILSAAVTILRQRFEGKPAPFLPECSGSHSNFLAVFEAELTARVPVSSSVEIDNDLVVVEGFPDSLGVPAIRYESLIGLEDPNWLADTRTNQTVVFRLKSDAWRERQGTDAAVHVRPCYFKGSRGEVWNWGQKTLRRQVDALATSGPDLLTWPEARQNLRNRPNEGGSLAAYVFEFNRTADPLYETLTCPAETSGS